MYLILTHAFWLIHHTRMLTETDNNLSLQGKKMWRCVVCYVFVALTLKSLFSHIHVTHSSSPDFRVLCGIDGCAKEYRVYFILVPR